MAKQGLPQRAAPKLVDTSIQTLQRAFDQAFSNIYQLQSSIRSVTAPTSVSPGLSGTHSERITDFPPGNYAAGTQFFETDRNLLYVVVTIASAGGPVNQWLYASGIYQRLQNQLASLKPTLTAYDNGLLAEVTDYRHILRWTSPSWGWGPGDDGRAGEGPIMREVDPNPTTGWHLYDGSTVAYLNADGTTTNVTLPDLTSVAANASYLKAGSPNSGPNAATPPTTAAGGSTNAAATGISDTQPLTGSVSVTPAAGSSVAVNPHTHPIVDPQHSHTFGAGAITINTDGQPRNLERRPWFRL
ncbi:MAG TPA: hypothetical protein VKQ11_00425 [Candidatus Sulfotelmatobacter sp.]|nr:hypothetical protein [Candidatus Sulfotelmatobacter sp.]